MNVVCFGDSITHAAEFSEANRWPNILQRKLDVWRPGAFTIFNRGIGGNTSAQGFDRLETDVIALMPGVVLVQFGFNDGNVRDWSVVPRVGVEEYKKNLQEFFRIAHTYGGHCVFVVNHAPDRVTGKQGNGKSYFENILPYNLAVSSIASALSASVIDLPAAMEEEKVEASVFLGSDGLHLSEQGNHIYAGLMFSGLRIILVQLTALNHSERGYS